MSNSINHENQFGSQELEAYSSSLRNNNNNAAFGDTMGAFSSSIQSIGDRISRSMDHLEGSEMSHTRHLMDLLGAAANQRNHHHHHHHQTQGLSLSLGSHMLVPPPPSDEYRHRPLNPGVMNPNYFMSQETTTDYFFSGSGGGGGGGGGGGFASSSASLNRSPSTSYGAESFAAVIGNSRYLKPVQSLLEDIVDVGGSVVDRINEKLFHGSGAGARTLSLEFKAELRNNGALLADKHEHQIKIAKLISLLDEVESRYEKYCHQMEEVVSSFEMIAGVGAAKCYTALALQAMSRHFSSLRDAIVSQINVEKRKLFHDLPKINSGISQLSLFDRDNNRHSRMSLQHLGMIQSQRQVWRPIRGLPETSVAILRSWLFEHFLHPYPNDSEKLMLASQTGLSKNQVSNWFINARVRLWKPMIEEMYKEEFGDSSEDSNPPVNNCLAREEASDCVED